MIPPKAFSEILERDAAYVTNPCSATCAAVEDAMDAYGWPWKASPEQIAYWNSVQKQRDPDNTLAARYQAAQAALDALGPVSECRVCWRSPGHLCEAHTAATVERNRCWSEWEQGVPRLEEADARWEDCRARVEEER